jgi:hypothetical protein
MSRPPFKIFRPEVQENHEEECLEREIASDREDGIDDGLASLILQGMMDPVRISAGDLLSLLQDAVASRRAWLQDFTEDSVVISRDFYEVLLAYKNMIQKKAA